MTLRPASALREGDLVADLTPPGPRYPGRVSEVWAAGAALLPVDARLPVPARAALLERARPTVVVDDEGWRRWPAGVPVEATVGLVMATSGTTGAPKLVELERSAVQAAVALSLEALAAGPEDRWLCCLPVAHVGGLLVVLRGLLGPAPVTVHPGFDPAAVDAERSAVLTSLVPTMLARLLDARVDLARFRAILVGGARLSPVLAERAAAAGARLVVTYGLTESCGGVVYDGVPLPGVSVRTGPGGEVELAGPTLMRAYRDDRPATERVLGGGWLRTGDAGHLRPDGRLDVAGRLDDAIVSGGEKVWPAEVEAVLSRHPAVAEVAVTARPDVEWGQRVVAVVVPRDGNRPPTLADLREFAAGLLPRYKAPSELVLVDRLAPGRGVKARA